MVNLGGGKKVGEPTIIEAKYLKKNRKNLVALTKREEA